MAVIYFDITVLILFGIVLAWMWWEGRDFQSPKSWGLFVVFCGLSVAAAGSALRLIIRSTGRPIDVGPMSYLVVGAVVGLVGLAMIIAEQRRRSTDKDGDSIVADEKTSWNISSEDTVSSWSKIMASEKDQQPSEPIEMPDSLAGLRILLVEDSHDIRETLFLWLEETGAQVTAVDQGLEARDLAVDALRHNDPYDLILMDTRLPGMDGFDVAAFLQEMNHPMPMVALIPETDRRMRDRCLSIGFSECLQKPIRREDLDNLLAELWQAHFAAMYLAHA